ncbi:Aste57867_19990 [Aphanomyces stellatus]|uniref:Aste57867_19990 protein n=1 Tax=Aphanomyces stellatus TaxID=120398 RepID=A0A485LDX9_9STRA|nr:hypothetical protein As57867_019924 [Aphanomyces stellatus]VFT96687.1 Aste57867_19990 [Aphanomyces stellatus]
MEQTRHFAQLLVQDHLHEMGMHDTLRAFTKEAADDVPPDVWYDVSGAVGLTGLVQDCHDSATTALVALLHFAIAERKKMVRAMRPALVRITDTRRRSKQQQRRLPSSASTPSILRPKSASAVAISASTPALPPAIESTSSSRHTSTPPPPSSNQDDETTARPTKATPTPAVAALRAIHDGSTSSRHVIASSTHNNPTTKPRRELPRLHPLAASSSSTDETRVNSPKWIPDDKRLRQVRRGLAQLQDELKTHNTFEKYHGHAAKPAPPHPTELVVVPCKLCLHPFPRRTLKHRVPYKALMDLRRTWDPALDEINPTIAKPPMCYDSVLICVFCAQFLHCAERYRPTDGPRAATRVHKHKPQTADEKRRNDPFACDPIVDSDESAGSGGGDGDSGDDGHGGDTARSTIGGQVGKNVRYHMHHAHTLRNLSQLEWGIIHPSNSTKHPSSHHAGGQDQATPHGETTHKGGHGHHHGDEEQSSPIKVLLMEATRHVGHTNQSQSSRHLHNPMDRRQTEEDARKTHR